MVVEIIARHHIASEQLFAVGMLHQGRKISLRFQCMYVTHLEFKLTLLDLSKKTWRGNKHF